MSAKIERSFFLNKDVIQISRQLIGKFLFTKFDGKLTGGIITETEAYRGVTDKASHAFGGRRTERTRIMYAEGGTAYVYLCYGIHSLFNIVTNEEDIPEAVLIRAIQPTHGINEMLKRRNKIKEDKLFTVGPGKVSQALGIHFSHSGINLLQNKIWIEDRGIKIKSSEIISGPRIGVDYAGEDAFLPYRFLIPNKMAVHAFEKIK